MALERLNRPAIEIREPGVLVPPIDSSKADYLHLTRVVEIPAEDLRALQRGPRLIDCGSPKPLRIKGDRFGNPEAAPYPSQPLLGPHHRAEHIVAGLLRLPRRPLRRRLLPIRRRPLGLPTV